VLLEQLFHHRLLDDRAGAIFLGRYGHHRLDRLGRLDLLHNGNGSDGRLDLISVRTIRSSRADCRANGGEDDGERTNEDAV
jgi:hypothetical protein